MQRSASLGVLAAAALALFASASASALTVTVNGTDDLYNATIPGTYEGTNPTAIDVTGLTSITFSTTTTTGITVNIGSGTNYGDADGVGSVSGENVTGSSVLSGIRTSTAGFVAGAFVGASISPTLPTALDFSTTTGTGTSFASLTPMLQQTFFIGDGLTGDGTGAVQTFYVPTGATTLYLGIADSCGYNGAPSCYNDNGGSFQVTTSSVSAVPEPASSTLALAGLAGFGLVGWRRRNAKNR